MTARRGSRPAKRNEAALAAASDELRAALQAIANAPGGPAALEDLAIKLILPIEEKVRRENPSHPTLALIDERRRRGELG